KADHLGFDNGIMFQGEEGRFFVNRGKLTGKPVEDLKDRPLPSDALEQLSGRKVTPNHMADFVECMKTRNTPVSDAESHHRNLSVCHAINIAMRLGRSLTFDPATETFQDDPQANGFLEREQRKGYEIVV
ncbi:MAG: gfo/Idh/MocA family oxidoreductase, partial [Planctomycetota bacterium]